MSKEAPFFREKRMSVITNQSTGKKSTEFTTCMNFQVKTLYGDTIYLF